MSEPVRVGIVTDSTADIPQEWLNTFPIEVVPALLIIDGKTYEDGKQLSRSDFYKGLPKYRHPPTTATPSIQYFEHTYQRHFDRGVHQILSIHVASTLSGIVPTASKAAEAFHDKVLVIDSGQLSLGIGYQVLEAAKCALQGASLAEVLQVAEHARKRVRVAALINTLEYLRRSGRVSWLSAGVGELLKIKQLLGVNEGAIEDLGKARTFDRALASLFDIMRSWGQCDEMAILHTGIPELAEKVATQVNEFTGVPARLVEVTTVIGAHIGPGSIGLAALTT